MRPALVLVTALLAGCAGMGPPPPGGYYVPPYQPIPFYPMSTQPVAPVQMPQYQAPQPQGYVANWTGKATPAMSVSGLSILQCEYMFAGRSFIRNFQGSCPATIQVQ